MNNYCNCKDNKCDIGDKSRNMYSVDYDSLIERLEKTKDEIDDTINLLKDKKRKDSVINDILSSEDDECECNDYKELEELIDEIRKNNNNYTITNTRYPYKYRPYPYKYPFRWYPTIWF